MCAKIVTVLNRKGGVGKTTLTIAIADTLISEHRADVTIVDLDPQATASQVLLTEHEFMARTGNNQNLSGLLAALLEREEEPEKKREGEPDKHDFRVDGLGKIKGKHREQLRLYPNSDVFWELEANEMARDNGSRLNEAVKKFLQQEKQDRHYVLVDCPPGQSIAAKAILEASDLVICPMTPDPYSVWGKGLLKRYFERKAPETRYKFVINRYDKRIGVHTDVLAKLRGNDHEADMLNATEGRWTGERQDRARFDVNASVLKRSNMTAPKPLYRIYGNNGEQQLKKIVDAILKELERNG